jgi:hypothetical protein
MSLNAGLTGTSSVNPQFPHFIPPICVSGAMVMRIASLPHFGQRKIFGNLFFGT